jgi:hypothetical protein
MSITTQLLATLPPEECKNYIHLELDGIPPLLNALVVNKKRKDLLNTLNANVLERMDFITELIDKLKMSDECRKHVYSTNEAEYDYHPLSIRTMNGAFALLVCLLSLSILVFTCECVFRLMTGRKSERVETVKEADLATSIHQLVSQHLLDDVNTGNEVIVKYFQFRELLLRCRK